MQEDDIFLMLEAVNGMSTGVDPDSDEVDAAWLRLQAKCLLV